MSSGCDYGSGFGCVMYVYGIDLFEIWWMMGNDE